MADPNIGYGSKLYVGSGVSAAYVQLTPVSKITVPVVSIPKVDSSHLTVPNRQRTYVPGLIEPGEFTFEIQYTDDNYEDLYELKGTVYNWKIEFFDGAYTVTAGYLDTMEGEIAADALFVLKCKVVCSATQTITTA